ncbi:hypothetical protein F5Y04DRAFT_263612 [Hypomontagnella monticulosa]|nr:hypothetical protein F5Y04DRAFT_263612 [Hypomontagnella monticulosa]
MDIILSSMASLSTSDGGPTLIALPADIFYIILVYLDTARSVAHLAATCKGLHQLISQSGWRIFVTSRFSGYDPSEVLSTDEWKERARSLTLQSRDWDRRALVVTALKPEMTRRARIMNRIRPAQSIPSSIIVDAHHLRRGNDSKDLVFWGAGEDVFGLHQYTRGPKANQPHTTDWLRSKGSSHGHHSGRDDVTCVSILKDSKYNYDHGYGSGDDVQVLVGRASGQLYLLSMDAKRFGIPLLKFRGLRESSPYDEAAIHQTEIQSLDVDYKRGTLAAATKQSVLVYPLGNDQQTVHDESNQDNLTVEKSPFVWANTALALGRKGRRSGSFEFIRSIKFVNDDTLAVALNKCRHPLQYLNFTPTGIETSLGTKIDSHDHSVGSYTLRTVRAILPVDTSSLAYGGGKAMLSSWDDGTIRLQDLRTPSPVDKIFQDNFDISTPINALLSHGLERFVAGSAYSPVLKIFDYRWPRGYYHTESLPCGNDNPYPAPRAPTNIVEPTYPSNSRSACDYVAGQRCRWHTLSRHDFYRPNFNMWLPISAGDNSPVYSLASPSVDSPSIFAGLSGNMVEITAKSFTRPVHTKAVRPTFWPDSNPEHVSYKLEGDNTPFIDTGSGFELEDVSQAQRVPPMYRQMFRDAAQTDHGHPKQEERAAWRKRHRLDEWLQRLPAELGDE